jgi:hypothetical protein
LLGAVLVDDSATVDLAFIGALANCMSYSGGEIVQSITALDIVPHATGIRRVAAWHTTVRPRRDVTVRLNTPLGGRVVVDLEWRRLGSRRRFEGLLATVQSEGD